MVFRLFDAPLREASQFVGFSGNRIDRQSEKRADDCVTTALADPSARVMLLAAGKILLKGQAGSFDCWFDLAQSKTHAATLREAILLGVAQEGPVLAVPCALDLDRLPEGLTACDYRPLYAQALVDEESAGALAQAAALLAWNASHRFCSRCGAETEMRAGGYRRNCRACGADHFPRTDPVAIMLTVTPEKCLLGRGRHFAPGMYSALAGFIEPGETIEAAVRRETLEEAGIRLGRVVYHASQPWPFPHSLMIGCFAEPLDEEIRADLDELEDCRWFSRDEVGSMLEGRHRNGLVMPPAGSIAHHLVRAWMDGDQAQ